MASIIEKMIRRGLRYSGFTLLEICTVIVIGGAALAGGVDIVKQYRAQEIIDINTARSTAIAAALEGYMLKNDALPCPAPRGIAADAAGYGVANCGVMSVPSLPGPNGPVLIGALPTQNLGLPYEDMVDAWNHQFTYAVTAKLTNPTASPTFQMDPTKGAVDIINPSAAGNPSLVMPSASSGKPAFFVVIGAGKDGAGAYTRDGAPPTVPCSAAQGYDSYNCSYLTSSPITDPTGLVFAQAPFSLAQGPHYFDNIVIYSNTVNKYDIPKCPAKQYLVENPADPNQHQLMCVQKLTAPVPLQCNNPPTNPPTVLTSIPCPSADPACNLPGNAPMANILGYGYKCVQLPKVPPTPMTCPAGENLTTNGAGLYTCKTPVYSNPVLPQCAAGSVLGTNASGAQSCRQVKITSQQVSCPAKPCPIGGCGSGTDDWGCVQTCPSGTVITGGFMEADNVNLSAGRISRMNSNSTTDGFGVAGNSYYCLMNFAGGNCTTGGVPCGLKCDAICSQVQ